jgi:hypothetical protein
MTADATRPAIAPEAPGALRRLARWLHPRRLAQLRLLLVGPIGWLVIAYLGSLFVLLLNAFWAKDTFTGQVIPFSWSVRAFGDLVEGEVYRTIALRTIGMAALVTLTDALLAFPIAYYMARVASPRTRNALVIAVLMPLWAAYLVKVYAWRTILQGNGVLEWALRPFGIEGPGLDELPNAWLVLSYLWLPYMILPIYAGLERIPLSLLEPRGHDLPPSHRAAGLSGRRRRLDLHVLADARRLHHAGPRRGREVHWKRHLRQLVARRPSARGRLLPAAHRDHGRVPHRRPAPGRLRVAVTPTDG